jgi:hypothetical protein
MCTLDEDSNPAFMISGKRKLVDAVDRPSVSSIFPNRVDARPNVSTRLSESQAIRASA